MQYILVGIIVLENVLQSQLILELTPHIASQTAVAGNIIVPSLRYNPSFSNRTLHDVK